MKRILTIIALNNIAENECYLSKDYFEKYKGFTLYKVIPEKELHLKQLNSIRIKYANRIEFWTEPRGLNQWRNIMASPLIKTHLEFDFTFVKMTFTISLCLKGFRIPTFQLSFCSFCPKVCISPPASMKKFLFPAVFKISAAL